METAGWIRLGLIAVVAIAAMVFLMRPKFFQRRPADETVDSTSVCIDGHGSPGDGSGD